MGTPLIPGSDPTLKQAQISTAAQFANTTGVPQEVKGKKEDPPPKILGDSIDTSDTTVHIPTEAEKNLDKFQATLQKALKEQSDQVKIEGFQTGVVGAEGQEETKPEKPQAQREPIGFFGTQGQEETKPEKPQAQREPIGFIGMQGKKTNTEKSQAQREPIGFFGTQGKEATKLDKPQTLKGKGEQAGVEDSGADTDADIQEADHTGLLQGLEKAGTPKKKRVTGDVSGDDSLQESAVSPFDEHPENLIGTPSEIEAVAIEKIKTQAHAEEIKATYHYATNPEVYTPPVNNGSVDTIFKKEKLTARQALPIVRNKELTPIPVEVSPLLEMSGGDYKPQAVLQSNGMHSGNLEPV